MMLLLPRGTLGTCLTLRRAARRCSGQRDATVRACDGRVLLPLRQGRQPALPAGLTRSRSLSHPFNLLRQARCVTWGTCPAASLATSRLSPGLETPSCFGASTTTSASTPGPCMARAPLPRERSESKAACAFWRCTLSGVSRRSRVRLLGHNTPGALTPAD